MRKFKTGIVVMAAVLCMSGMTAFAAEDVTVYAGCGYCGASCQFVDADGDGICDNYAAGGCGYCGASCQFVDADGDGICDNYAAAGSYCGRGYGRGYGRHHGRGRHCR